MRPGAGWGHYPRVIVSAEPSLPQRGTPPDDTAALVPHVQVVVVAHDPGEWFAAVLGAIAAQAYDNLSVLVVDAGSVVPIAEEVALLLPDATCVRLATNPGFGPACNTALDHAEGVAFHLFCHDDVALAPDTVALLVAEAFRANAGVVGPKLVQWGEPQRLLALGMGADRLGQPAPVVERGEMDQGQHDALRDVFFVPGGATLVRADLFGALDGFDPDISFHGEDLDLCWRARVLGAAVTVAPDARVAHLEALALRRPDDRRRLQLRHRLRTLRVASGVWSRIWLVPLAVVLGVFEALGALLLGRFSHVADVVAAGWWNVRHGASLRRRRAALAAVRAVPDTEVRAEQSRGLARLRALRRARRGEGGGLSVGRGVVAVWAAVAAVLVFGSRSLFGDLPAVGDFVDFPASAGELWSVWWGGWQPVGAGAAGVSPPLLGVFWLASMLSLGATGVARGVLILGALPLALVGVWRLAVPLGSTRVRVVALVVALANPITYDAIALGRWPALALAAVTPWVVLHLLRAAAIAPYDADGRSRRPAWHVVAAGMLVAVATLWFPAAPLAVAIVVVAALAAGGVVALRPAGGGRLVAVGLAAVLVAVVVCAPWLADVARGGEASVWLGPASGTGAVPSGLGLLRFEGGPVGSSVLGFALPLVGLPALLFGRHWRFTLAVRAWAVVVVGWAVVALAGAGWLGVVATAPDLLLAPAVSMLALAAAAGVAAFATDLPGYRAGWRQLASLVAAVAVVAALVPVFAAAFGGRWGLPERDFSDQLAFIDDQRTAEPFRVLWVSEADLLPLAGWPLDAPGLGAPAPAVGTPTSGPRLAWGTTSGGLPGPDTLFSVAPPSGTRQLAGALEAAVAGDTVRLGELVGPMGVRYVVVPRRLAPGSEPLVGSTGGEPPRGATPVAPAGSAATGVDGVVDALSRQLDLEVVPLGGDVVVWSNTAWVPTQALYPPAALDVLPVTGADGDDDVAAPLPALAGGVGVLAADGPVGGAGELPALQATASPVEGETTEGGGGGVGAQVWAGTQADAGWSLRTSAGDLPPTDVAGWAMRFDGATAGEATLTFATPLWLRVALLACPALWLVALWWLVRTRAIDGPRRVGS